MNTTYVTVQRGEVDEEDPPSRTKRPHPLVELHYNYRGDLLGVSIFGTDLQVTTETGTPREEARIDAERIAEHRAMIARVEASLAEQEAYLAEHPPKPRWWHRLR
jgi:hypothetical protein